MSKLALGKGLANASAITTRAFGDGGPRARNARLVGVYLDDFSEGAGQLVGDVPHRCPKIEKPQRRWIAVASASVRIAAISRA